MVEWPYGSGRHPRVLATGNPLEGAIGTMDNRTDPYESLQRNNFDEDEDLLECFDTDDEDDESTSKEGTRLTDE